MRRRAFVAALTGGILGWPPAALAQRAAKVPRIGYVSSNRRTANVDAFDQGLRDRGYVIGQNVLVDYRFADGQLDRVRPLVDEVLALGVDVVVAANPHVIRVGRQVTRAVPIVGVDLETDPVAAGWVKTLARPGGNVTGVFLDMPELSGKLVQFLAEAVPHLQRVAVLWDKELAPTQFDVTARAARSTKLELQPLPFHEPGEFPAVFDAAQAQQAQAMVILSSPAVFPNLGRLAGLAREHRLPAISAFSQFAAAGGLIGYGPNFEDLYRQVAGYVDRLFKGEKAADMPIQRPAVFALVINLKTARELRLTIPQSLSLRADEIIQ